MPWHALLAVIDVGMLATAALVIGFATQIALAVRVVMRRIGVGESLAWIFLVLVLPLAGPILYLLFGELRLGSKRARKIAELRRPVVRLLEELIEQSGDVEQLLDRQAAPLARLARNTLGMPVLPGNKLELIADWQQVFDRLIADIDAAQHHCHLEFYIVEQGGRAGEVLAALERAAARGVACRLLADSVGSRPFARSKRMRELRAAGVDVVFALPGGFIRMWFVRFDLRMHRKIVVIDGQVGYTGSLNLVDPRYFKQDSGVGEWVDAMARVTGPAVDMLAMIFLADWYVESDETIEQLRERAITPPATHHGQSLVQVLPSGPSQIEGAVDEVLVSAIYAAQREVILTTPYFVPNEALMTALESAWHRCDVGTASAC
jgi:cardiolipin synthase